MQEQKKTTKTVLRTSRSKVERILKATRFYWHTDAEFINVAHKEPCIGCSKVINFEYCLDTLFGVVLCDFCQQEFCDWVALHHKRKVKD